MRKGRCVAFGHQRRSGIGRVRGVDGAGIQEAARDRAADQHRRSAFGIAMRLRPADLTGLRILRRRDADSMKRAGIDEAAGDRAVEQEALRVVALCGNRAPIQRHIACHRSVDANRIEAGVVSSVVVVGFIVIVPPMSRLPTASCPHRSECRCCRRR